MKNLQQLLLELFNSLDEDIKEIVSEVYSLEKEYMDFYQVPHGIKEKIKAIIDRNARFILNREANNENSLT